MATSFFICHHIYLNFHKNLFENEKNDISKIPEISIFKNVDRKIHNLSSLMNVNNNGNDFIVNNFGKKNDEGNNKRNEMKAMINRKLVYLNSNGTDLHHYSNNFQKSKKIIFKKEGRRGSKYRGVSKNGNRWQILIMINKSKSTYAGTYTTEDFAARVYDILSIKNRGNKAMTNFVNSESQMQKVFNTDVDIGSKNFKKIIADLLKDN